MIIIAHTATALTIAAVAAGPDPQHGRPRPGIDRVFIAESVPEAAPVVGAMLFQVASDAIEADICVTARPGALEPLVDWSLALSGGMACDAPFLQGSSGSSVKYEAAVKHGGSRRMPRYVWMSDGFRTVHREEALLLLKAVALGGSVWAVAESRERFADLSAHFMTGPARQQRPMQAVCLISGAEAVRMRRRGPLPKNVFVGTVQFLTKMKKLHEVDSHMGA